MTTAIFVNNAMVGPGRYSADHLLGLDALSGLVPGMIALAAGLGGGWLRWATRSPATS